MSPFMYKWLKLSLVSLVAMGFVAMAVYAFIKRDEIRAAQIEPPLIEAPTQALKTRPESPGGLAFPNQDKLVFDLLEGSPAAVADITETVTGTAEATLEAEPLEVTGAAAASSFAPASPSPSQLAIKLPTVTPTLPQGPQAVPQGPVPPKVAEEAVKPAQPAKVKEVATKPEPKPAAPAPKTMEVKTAEKVTPKPAGSWSVQLAAVGSSADAQTAGKQLQAKFSGLKALSIRVVPAPGGQRYRVQFTGLANRAAAQSVCDKLGSQPCFPVGK